MLAQSERFPKGERRSVADIDLELPSRKKRLRMGTFDDNRRHHRAVGGLVPADRVSAGPHRSVNIGLHREVERFPVCCRPIRIGCSGTVTRPTAFRSPGSSSGCARCTSRKFVIGISGGLDSNACVDRRPARAMDREDRPRQRHSGVHLAGLRHRRAHQTQCSRALPAPLGVTFCRNRHHPRPRKLMLKEMDPSVLARREGLRRHVRERPGRAAARITCSAWPISAAESFSAPVISPSWDWVGPLTVSAIRCRITTSTQVVPQGHWFQPLDPLGHLPRNQFPVGCGRGVAIGAGHRDHPPNSCRPAKKTSCRAAKRRSVPFALQDFSLFQILRYGLPAVEDRLLGVAWRGAMPITATGHRDIRKASGRPTRSRRSGTGCRSSCSVSTRSASSNGQPCLTGPRCPTVGRCRRAETGRAPVGHVGSSVARCDRARGPGGLGRYRAGSSADLDVASRGRLARSWWKSSSDLSAYSYGPTRRPHRARLSLFCRRIRGSIDAFAPLRVRPVPAETAHALDVITECRRGHALRYRRWPFMVVETDGRSSRGRPCVLSRGTHRTSPAEFAGHQ